MQSVRVQETRLITPVRTDIAFAALKDKLFIMRTDATAHCLFSPPNFYKMSTFPTV